MNARSVAEGRGRMLYGAYQAQLDLLAPARAFADFWTTVLSRACFGPATNALLQGMAAGTEVFSRAQLRHGRPAYRIDSATVEGRAVAVREEVALETPFGSLLHFRKETNRPQPRVLIVAPMAGHFATLLRHTARTMLNDHDVYITDWKSAR